MRIINSRDIMETIEMLTAENLDVRTVTMGISLLDCIDPDGDKACEKIYNKIVRLAGNLVPVVDGISAEYGIPIVNKRISVTPIAMLLGAAPDADRRGNHGAGKAQRTGGVEHIEGGRVGRLAGEILHRHFIRAGPHRLPGRRKIQRVTGLEVRLVPHLEVIPLVGGNVREGVLEQVGGHRQLVRHTEQPGRQHAEHGQLHRQQGSEQPVALAESKEMFHP